MKELPALPARLPWEPWRLLALKLVELRPEAPRMRFRLHLDLRTQQKRIQGMHFQGGAGCRQKRCDSKPDNLHGCNPNLSKSCSAHLRRDTLSMITVSCRFCETCICTSILVCQKAQHTTCTNLSSASCVAGCWLSGRLSAALRMSPRLLTPLGLSA